MRPLQKSFGKKVQGFLNFPAAIDLFDHEQMKNLKERNSIQPKEYFNLFKSFCSGPVMVLVFVFSFLISGKAFSQRSVIDSLKKENAKKNPPIPHAELNTLIAFNYLNINNDTALYFSNEAIRISEEDHVDTTLVKAYIIKCYALENLGEVDEALACNDTAIAQAEKFNRPRQLFSAYMIRGTLYRRKARYAEALDFYLKCTEIAEKK